MKKELDEQEIQYVIQHTNAEVIYTCKSCGRNTGWDTVEEAYKHVKKCVYNKDNKSCVMCKHLKVMEQAPLPRLVNEYHDIDVNYAFGDYNYGVCMLSGEKLDTDTVLGGCSEYEFEDIPAELGKTDERVKWEETIDLIDKQEKEINEEIIKDKILQDHKEKS